MANIVFVGPFYNYNCWHCLFSRFYAALNGILTIRNLERTDAKKYQCIATNKHGYDTSEVNLNVKGEIEISFDR